MKTIVLNHKHWLIGLCLALALLFTSLQTANAATAHTVQYGDTLGTIAQQYNISASAVAQANNIINPNLIYIGQLLTIPDGSSSGNASTAAPSNAVQQIHVVQAGDSLGRIANRYGVTLYAIQTANNIANSNYIYPGQSLVIPAGGNNFSPPAPAAPVATGAKSIIVDISDQRTYVYQGGTLIYNFVSSTGLPGADTWVGSYTILNKIPNAYASTWDLQMPNWMGIYWAGSLQNGFHSLPILSNGEVLWGGYLGTPVSYGCVILSYADSSTLYNWADIGTPVTVRY